MSLVKSRDPSTPRQPAFPRWRSAQDDTRFSSFVSQLDAKQRADGVEAPDRRDDSTDDHQPKRD